VTGPGRKPQQPWKPRQDDVIDVDPASLEDGPSPAANPDAPTITTGVPANRSAGTVGTREAIMEAAGKGQSLDLAKAAKARPRSQAKKAAGGVKGKRFGKFTIIKEIARGGMGIVYLAVDPSLKRQVALKVLIAGEGASEQSIKRFIREARAASHLRHPHIVSVHEAGTVGNTHYFTMDVVQGTELGDLYSKLTLRERIKVVYRVCDAVHFAHEQGIIHRDLKPGNIMVDLHHNPFVMDFGLARDQSSNSLQSVTGQVLGTPAYMSPEQAQGMTHEIDHRTDIFSMGAILYLMVTGEQAFKGETMFDTMFAVVNKNPPPPREVNPKVDGPLETIVLRCLEKDPDQRYQTMRELADDLKGYLTNRGIGAKRISARTRGWRWLQERPALKVSLLAGGPALAVLVIMLALFLGGTPLLDELSGQIRSGVPSLMDPAIVALRENVQEGKWQDQELRGRVIELCRGALTGESAKAQEVATEILVNDLEHVPAISWLVATAGHMGLDPERRVAALRAVKGAALGGAELPENIVEEVQELFLASTQNPHVRVESVETLGTVVDKRHRLQDLLKKVILRRDEMGEVRVAAIEAVARDLRLTDKAMGTMMMVMGDEDREVVAAAEKALDRAANAPSVLAAYGIDKKSGNAFTGAGQVVKLNAERNRLAQELADELENPGRPADTGREEEEQIPARVIAADLEHEDVGKRIRACVALGTHGNAGSVKVLIPRLADEDPAVQQAAVRSLVRLAVRHHVPTREVAGYLERDGDQTRAHAARLLGRLERREAVPAIAAALAAEENTYAARQMIAALARIADPAGLDSLQAALDRDPDNLGTDVIRAWKLKNAWNGAALDHLVATLERTEPGLRRLAREQLEDLTGQKLDDPSEWRSWLAEREEG